MTAFRLRSPVASAIAAHDLQIGLNAPRFSAYDLADAGRRWAGWLYPRAHRSRPAPSATRCPRSHTAGHVTVLLDVFAGRWSVALHGGPRRPRRDAFIALRCGKEFGRIVLDRDDDAWREQLFPVDLQADDVLRIDARADADGADFCRISHILLQPEGGLGAGMAARLDGSVLTVTQPAPIAAGVPLLSAEVRLVGRALRCRLRPLGEATAPAGIVGLTLLPSEGTADARLPVDPFLNERIVVLPDGGLYSTFIDRFNSHCTEYHPGATALDDGVEAFGRVRYLPNRRAPQRVQRGYHLTASRGYRMCCRASRVAGRAPAAPPSAIASSSITGVCSRARGSSARCGSWPAAG